MPSKSTQQFAYNIEEAHKSGNTTRLQDEFNDWQRLHCYDPQQLILHPAHSKFALHAEVDCGRCYHCRESKINSWVTRMYAHCEDYKYVYFITLTYRPFYNLGPVSELVFKKIGSALFHYDNFNKEHRLGWNPTLLCKKHYQDFFKRLRKETQNNGLTYAIAGEYGHQYGRPHFHIILFSKSPVSVESVRRAWSIGLWKDDDGTWSYLKNQQKHGKRYYFEIGRIQFDDLVQNGSFNEKSIEVDGESLNARNCFAYVCKYVCKGGKFNTKRLRLAFDSLYETYEVRRSLYGDFYDEYLKMTDEERKRMRFDANLKFNLTRFKQFDYVTYKETRFSPSDEIAFDDLPLCKKVVAPFPLSNEINSQFIYPKDFTEFCAAFGQFVEVSRGCPLGSLYAQAHICEFVQGRFPRPNLQTKGFVVPSYFRRKAEEYVYGLRRMQKTIRSKSFTFTSLPLLLEHFKSVLEGNIPYKFVAFVNTSHTRDYVLREGSSVFKDLRTGEYIIFPFERNCQFSVFAEYYRYNRASRSYELTRITSLEEFLRKYIPEIEQSIARYEKSVSLANDNARLIERSALLLEDYGYTLKNLRTRFAKEQDEYLTHRDHTYNMTHESVE